MSELHAWYSWMRGKQQIHHSFTQCRLEQCWLSGVKLLCCEAGGGFSALVKVIAEALMQGGGRCHPEGGTTL